MNKEDPNTRPGWWKPLAAAIVGIALLIALVMYLQGVFDVGVRHYGPGWAFLLVLAWTFIAMKLLTWGVGKIVSSLREPAPSA